MKLSESRQRIDVIDRELVKLLEQRMDTAADIADYKTANDLPVLDRTREAQKLSSIRSLCRPETADLICGLFENIMAASRDWQTTRMENTHGK